MKRRGFVEIANSKFMEIVADIVASEFRQPHEYAKEVVYRELQPFVNCLRADLSVYLETQYVDKVYRDSYYRYYSAKALIYPRDCIRLSFFDNSSKKFCSGCIPYNIAGEVKSAYCGFIVLRPTMPSIIGRSAISPKAFKCNNFVSCSTRIETSVDGYKVNVEAFPSSSQDTESITCAETTLWALMEYYGNKYPEHTPIKPSCVVQILRNRIAGRQLPSNGLNADCLTYAIKAFGFEPRLYHEKVFNNLHNILACYVESGIPMVVALSNEGEVRKKMAKRLIGHALLCVGHEKVSASMIDAAVSKCTKRYIVAKGYIDVLDYDDIEKRFLFVDDNFPPYQLDSLASPANRYNRDADWTACRIASIVAPLQDKIFMEPFMVKEYVINLLQSHYFVHYCNSKITIRTYLCSTRSYVNYVKSCAMSDQMKNEISNLFMPKFVWVTEISDVDGLKRNEVRELILLDATARQMSYFSPILAAFINGRCYRKMRETNALHSLPIMINPFNSYSNLK